jgi:hypothetical protein
VVVVRGNGVNAGADSAAISLLCSRSTTTVN